MDTYQKQLPDLSHLGLASLTKINYQFSVAQLIEQSILRAEGYLTNNGSVAVNTGKFTGRSPKDRFIVDDDVTHNTVNWGDVNLKFNELRFESLHLEMLDYLTQKEVFLRDSSICANKNYQLKIRSITETAYQDLFIHHLFIQSELINNHQNPEWTIIAAPGFFANPEKDGTRQANFTIISFAKKTILIGGSGYAGEIKKAIFTVLNFILPHQKNVLSMHCAANLGKHGDTAIFFGLSGTGKTTLSADKDRFLIGDDEHGWDNHSLFNFEGGCYAKCAGLKAENEPQIYNAIGFGALLENVNFLPGSRTVDFDNIIKTENTRAAYPLSFITNAVQSSVCAPPKNIFFLTADAFGVLPPIAKLSVEQAMYYFISGYTAKLAGTETDITIPKATFSACFGEAFMPLHPMVYAQLLAKQIRESNAKVWLVNTGWIGGAYGVGERIKLSYTRAMIKAVLEESLNDVAYQEHPLFKLLMPLTCEGVPDHLLHPKNTWKNKDDYFKSAANLARGFIENFSKYKSDQFEEIAQYGPVLNVMAQSI